MPPVVGVIHGFFTDVLGTLEKLYEDNGPVFQATSLGLNIHFLLGADAVETVLMNREGVFSSKLGWQPFIDQVFPGAIMAMDGDEHRYQRRIMQSAFGKDELRNYLVEMNPTIDAGLDQWAGHAVDGQLKIFPAIKKLTLDIATSAFVGVEINRKSDAMNDAFVDAVEAALALIRWPIPPFKMWRGVRGRKLLLREYGDLLPAKKRERLPDLFSQLCHATSEDGEQYTDAEIVDHMIFLMMAAHDTSTSTLNTMIFNLARYPEWQDRLREDAVAIGKPMLEYDDLKQTERTTWVMKESLRMIPPLTSMPRMAVRDFEVSGYRIPKDSLIGIYPIHTHHMPEYWTNPHKFDPERFSDERREDLSHKYAWTPFGGGMHKCIGQHFGQMEIRAVMHQLLLKYRWTVPEGYELPYQMVPIAKPKDGLPVTIESI